MRIAKLLLRRPRDTPCALTEKNHEVRVSVSGGTCGISFVKDVSDMHTSAVDFDVCNACKVVAGSGCFLDSASLREDGVMVWSVVAPGTSALDWLIQRITESGCAVALERVAVVRTSKELSREQERALSLALELGYFEVPRQVSLDQLAERFGLPKTVLDVMLKRAQRKVIADHMSRGRGGPAP